MARSPSSNAGCALSSYIDGSRLSGIGMTSARTRERLVQRLQDQGITRPAVLFADEPTGNLDAATGGIVAELLFGLNAASGTTLVLVTHERSLAARCSRRLELAAGRLVGA